jgi:hypothetical protein
VGTRITPQAQGQGANADAVRGAAGGRPRGGRARAADPSGGEERGRPAEGEPGNWGEPRGSLVGMPEEPGERRTKSPGGGRELPAARAPEGGHTQRERTREGEASEQRRDPSRARGRRSRAYYQRRWGREAHAPHGREGEARGRVGLGGQRGRTSSLPPVSTHSRPQGQGRPAIRQRGLSAGWLS